jgi:hypothetical protein
MNYQNSSRSVNIDTANVGNIFTNNNPRFSLLLPAGLSLEKLQDSNGVLGLSGENNDIVFQISIFDMFTANNLQGTNLDRTGLNYNNYSASTMEANLNSLSRKAINNTLFPYKTNIEYAVCELKGNTFVYIKFEIPYYPDNETFIKIAYNFLKDGFNIEFVGMYDKNDKKSEISVSNILNSIEL